VERVLLIRLSSLGDVVLTEPVVRVLRDAFPGVVVELATAPPYVDLMRQGAGLDRVWAVEKRKVGSLHLKSALRKRSFDLSVDLHRSFESRVLSWMSGSAHHLSVGPPSFGQHTVDRYIEPVKAVVGDRGIGDNPASTDPRLEGLWRPRVSKGRTIGLAPGARRDTKRWPVDRFIALADRLLERDPESSIVLIGGPEERQVFQSIRSSVKPSFKIDIESANLDVLALADRMVDLDLLISGDTGPAHLARALRVPTLTLFGPTTPRQWGSRSPGHRALSLGLACSPCSRVGRKTCPLDDQSHECMQALSVENVVQAAEALLSERK
jgi:ADP-heptose:LPS heptosyltransferase